MTGKKGEAYHHTDYNTKRAKPGVPVAVGVATSVAGAIYATKEEIGQVVKEIRKNFFDDDPPGGGTGSWRETVAGQPAELNFDEFVTIVLLVGIIVWGITKVAMHSNSGSGAAHA